MLSRPSSSTIGGDTLLTRSFSPMYVEAMTMARGPILSLAALLLSAVLAEATYTALNSRRRGKAMPSARPTLDIPPTIGHIQGVSRRAKPCG